MFFHIYGQLYSPNDLFMHVRTKDHAKCTLCFIYDNAFEGDNS